MAKTPAPGRSKTRLCPPCTAEQAAHLAEAALVDTLHAVVRTRARRCVLVLDGPPGDWLPDGIEVVAQPTGPLAHRVAATFELLGAPTVMIGADTPQVTVNEWDAAVASLATPGVDAVLGPASDGGYWTVGLRRPAPDAFDGVPMSTPHTGRIQLDRLQQCGLHVHKLPERRDVDTITDARAVAASHPVTRFARLLDEFGLTREARTDLPATRS